ncbi:MAG: NAD(P)H-dependent oxidoreductase [Candidatus Omnitrophota bacterium]
MSARRKALLLVGSNKAFGSTSEYIGTHLLSLLSLKGIETEKIHIKSSLNSEEGVVSLLESFESAGIIIFSSPLYIDSTPSAVTRLMEIISERYKNDGMLQDKRMLAISNCGLPEASHNDTALAVYRCFAGKTGLKWAGGLGLGMGPLLAGRPVEKSFSLVRNLRKSLEFAAGALAGNAVVPQESISLMAKPVIPVCLYSIIPALFYAYVRIACLIRGCKMKLKQLRFKKSGEPSGNKLPA